MGASPSDAALRANPAERPIETRATSSLAGASRWLALLGAFLIHASLLSFLLVERWLEPAIPPMAQEIPVELVVEPPPPPPQEPDEPAAKPDPPPAPPIDLAPANDAPRAANDEKVERQAPDEATKAPGAPTTAQAPSLSPTPAEEAAGPTQQNEPRAAENSAEPVVAKAEEETKAAEADQEAPAQLASADANPQPEKPPALIGAPFPTWSSGAQFATSDYLPGIELGQRGRNDAGLRRQSQIDLSGDPLWDDHEARAPASARRSERPATRRSDRLHRRRDGRPDTKERCALERVAGAQFGRPGGGRRGVAVSGAPTGHADPPAVHLQRQVNWLSRNIRRDLERRAHAAAPQSRHSPCTSTICRCGAKPARAAAFSSRRVTAASSISSLRPHFSQSSNTP